MATEKGVVTKLGFHTAWVKTTQSAVCTSCASKGSCTAMGNNNMEVEAINTAGAQVGDRIILSIETSSLLKASFLLYVFPILCMIIGAIIGHGTAPLFHFDASTFSAVIGFLFFSLAVMFVKLKGNKLAEKDRYKPRITRILKRQ